MPDPALFLPVELTKKIVHTATLEKYPGDGSTAYLARQRVNLPLSLVSHYWHDLVQPSLYASVELTDLRRSSSLVDTLRRRPELGVLVREVRSDNGEEGWHDAVVSQVICACPRLEELMLVGHGILLPWRSVLEDSPAGENTRSCGQLSLTYALSFGGASTAISQDQQLPRTLILARLCQPPSSLAWILRDPVSIPACGGVLSIS